MTAAYAEGGESRQRDCQGKTFQQEALWQPIESALAKSNVAEKWEREKYTGLIRNPLDIYLVSTQPTVIALCKPGPRALQSVFPVTSKTFSRGVILSTEMLCDGPVEMALDARMNPIPIVQSVPDIAVIRADGVEIRFRHRDSIWSVER